ncbi:MAG: TniQ family protein [Gallionella sp.]|nr:TniQ family protein [Gallionella sp.]
MKINSQQTKLETISTESGSQIYLFPLVYPDELHVSQASRFHNDSGNISTGISYQQLYESAPFCLTHGVPKYLERFAAKLPGDTSQNVEKLLRQTTLFPLFEVYGNARLSLSGDAMPIANQIVNMPKRIVGESGETHLCVDCLRCDRDEWGQPYIHRAHQIPGVQVCWRHEARLLSCCPNCGCPFERKNEFILTPWMSCEGCGLSLTEESFYTPVHDASASELSYAQFSREMLLSPTVPLDAAQLAGIYKSRLVEMGFSRGSMINRKAIFGALEEHYGKDALARIDSAYRLNKNQHWFSLAGESTVFDAPLPRHLALSHFLFGSAPAFWKFAAKPSQQPRAPVTALEIMEMPKTPSIRSADTLSIEIQDLSHEFSSERKSYRARIIEILHQHPDWTIDDLWKAYPGLMKRLLRTNDDGFVWLKAIIDGNDSMEGKKPALSIVTQHPDDLKWARNFAGAAVALYNSTDMPKKITRNFLMREAGWERTNMPNPTRFPLARQKLELLKESAWHFYARRILWAKLHAGAVGASERGVLGASGIEHHQGLLVLERFSSVPANRTLGPGTIMDILNEYKIPKDWGGPVCDQVFIKPGRNSSHGGLVSAAI